MTPADLNGNLRAGHKPPPTQELCRVYAKPAAVDNLFDVPPVWSQLGSTGILSTICRVSSIKKMDEMQKAAIAIVPQAQWIAQAEDGIVDFFPERVRVNGKYETDPKWKGVNIIGIHAELAKAINFTRWGVYSYYGRLALRVVVPKEHYGTVTAIARALHLQIERVSASPICVAQLTVRNVSGSADAVPLRVYEAQYRIANTYPVSWGKSTTTETETTVLAYITQDLTAKDHFSEMQDGVRTIFTPMLAAAAGKSTPTETMERTKAVHDSWTLLQLDDVECEKREDGTAADTTMERSSEEREIELATATTSLSILNDSIEAQKRALRKTAGSWKAYNLGAAAECAALGVLDELRTRAMEQRDEVQAEHFAAWLNACPSPAKILEAASAGPSSTKETVACLERALSRSAQPPKVSTLSELNATARQAASGGQQSYSTAALKGLSARTGRADNRRARAQ